MLPMRYVWRSLQAIGAGLGPAGLLWPRGRTVPAPCGMFLWLCSTSLPFPVLSWPLLYYPKRNCLFYRIMGWRESLEVFKSSPCVKQRGPSLKMRRSCSGSCPVEMESLKPVEIFRFLRAWWRHPLDQGLKQRWGITIRSLCLKSHLSNCSLLKYLGERPAGNELRWSRGGGCVERCPAELLGLTAGASWDRTAHPMTQWKATWNSEAKYPSRKGRQDIDGHSDTHRPCTCSKVKLSNGATVTHMLHGKWLEDHEKGGRFLPTVASLVPPDTPWLLFSPHVWHSL